VIVDKNGKSCEEEKALYMPKTSGKVATLKLQERVYG
jgi:hypothetical protein